MIEFARGKALERLRRYADAVAAYQRVAASGSLLGDAAAERPQVIDSFRPRLRAARRTLRKPRGGAALHRGADRASGDSSPTEVHGTPYESLALEEARPGK